MKSLVVAWRDRCKENSKTKSPEPTRLHSSSSSSNQDSAYGSSTTFSSAAVSGISSLSQRSNSVESSDRNDSIQNQKDELPKKPSRKLSFTQTSSPCHKAVKSSNHTGSPSPFPSVSFTRFKAAFSRLLPRKKDHSNHGQARQYKVSSSLTDRDRAQFNGSLFQQLHPRTIADIKSPSFVPIHPLSAIFDSTPVSPVAATIHTSDVTAPACFPGAGPVDLAVKRQQLQQLQQTSVRPCSTSTGPTSSVLKNKRSRHLIPHHRYDLNTSGITQSTLSSTTDLEMYGAGLHSSLAARRSSIGSLSIASACCPTPSLTSSTSYNHQFSVSSWTALSQERRPSTSAQSMNDMEFIAGNARMAKGSGPQRRCSNFSIASDGLLMYTGEHRTVPKNKFGQGYDISTMFQLGPLPQS